MGVRRKRKSHRFEVSPRRHWIVWLGVALGLGLLVVGLGRRWGWGRETWRGLGIYRIEEVVVSHAKVKQVYLWEFSEEEQTVRKWELPIDLVVQVVGFPGKYRLGAVYDLSLQETGTTEMFRWTSAYSLGLLVNRVVVNEDSQPPEQGATAFVWKLIHEVIRGDLPIGDWWRLRAVAQQTPGAVKPRVVADMQVLGTETEVDGTTYMELNQAAWDAEYEKIVPVPSVTWRSLSAYVYNTTGEAGLATTWARLLSHQGIYVRGVGDTSPVREQSSVVVSSQVGVDGEVMTGLSQLVPGIKVTEGDTSVERSEAVLYLGNDLRVAGAKQR